MIRVVIMLDVDAPKIGDWKREMEAAAEPTDYAVTELHCTGWGRKFQTGAVEMSFAFKVTSPPDVLPRIDIYGGKCALDPAPAPTAGRPRKRQR